MSTLDVTNLKSKLALTPVKFYDKDDKEIGTLCRAWVNFNGTTETGGYCTIRASFNVSSVTDNGTGDYTINFTNAMPDINYSYSGATQNSSGHTVIVGREGVPQTTTTLRIKSCGFDSNGYDRDFIMVQVFR